MRVLDDRYSVEMRSINLARRMFALEARPQTVCAWTKLTADRVRNLARGAGGAVVNRETQRQRGPSPSCLPTLLSTLRTRSEAAAVAGLCRVAEVLPEKAVPNARESLPGLARGERLVATFELFRHLVPNVRLTFEQLVLVIVSLAEGDSWAIDHCIRCHATILIDQLGSDPRRLCVYCAPRLGPTKDAPPDSDPCDSKPARAQQSLFD
jgi:hypothetical protein